MCFGAESGHFDVPVATTTWSRVADWDVSKVIGMEGLFRNDLLFDQDIGG